MQEGRRLVRGVAELALEVGGGLLGEPRSQRSRRRIRNWRAPAFLVRATPSTRAIYTQAFSLPPWPEDKSPWRYLLRCRSSSLQDLSSSGTLLY